MKEQERYGYAKLSNAFWRNGKIMTLQRVNLPAIAYYILLLTYCSDNLTDGVIPDIAIHGVFAVPDDVMELLVEIHLLDKVGESFSIHDYLKWNMSGKAIEQEKAVRREQTRKRVEKFRAKQKTAESVNVDSSEAVTPRNAPVTPCNAQLRTKNLELRTNISFSSKPSFSKFASTAYQPDEKEKNKMKETHKISEAHYVKLLAGFHDWWDGQDELKSQTQWNHFLDGWIAKNKDNPKFQAHKHTWACEHTLHALGVASTAQLTSRYEQADNLTYGNQLAQRVSSLLNAGVSEQEAVRQARASVSAGGEDTDSFRSRVEPLEASNCLDQALVQAGGLQALYTPVEQLVGA